MNQAHNDLYGNYQEIGESDILYEQVHVDHASGILIFRNVREARATVRNSFKIKTEQKFKKI